ncbi:hypothetical protein ACFXA6_54180, partial [Streptomyces mirabilis]
GLSGAGWDSNGNWTPEDHYGNAIAFSAATEPERPANYYDQQITFWTKLLDPYHPGTPTPEPEPEPTPEPEPEPEIEAWHHGNDHEWNTLHTDTPTDSYRQWERSNAPSPEPDSYAPHPDTSGRATIREVADEYRIKWNTLRKRVESAGLKGAPVERDGGIYGWNYDRAALKALAQQPVKQRRQHDLDAEAQQLVDMYGEAARSLTKHDALTALGGGDHSRMKKVQDRVRELVAEQQPQDESAADSSRDNAAAHTHYSFYGGDHSTWWSAPAPPRTTATDNGSTVAGTAPATTAPDPHLVHPQQWEQRRADAPVTRIDAEHVQPTTDHTNPDPTTRTAPTIDTTPDTAGATHRPLTPTSHQIEHTLNPRQATTPATEPHDRAPSAPHRPAAAVLPTGETTHGPLHGDIARALDPQQPTNHTTRDIPTPHTPPGTQPGTNNTPTHTDTTALARTAQLFADAFPYTKATPQQQADFDLLAAAAAQHLKHTPTIDDLQTFASEVLAAHGDNTTPQPLTTVMEHMATLSPNHHKLYLNIAGQPPISQITHALDKLTPAAHNTLITQTSGLIHHPGSLDHTLLTPADRDLRHNVMQRIMHTYRTVGDAATRELVQHLGVARTTGAPGAGFFSSGTDWTREFERAQARSGNPSHRQHRPATAHAHGHPTNQSTSYPGNFRMFGQRVDPERYGYDADHYTSPGGFFRQHPQAREDAFDDRRRVNQRVQAWQQQQPRPHRFDYLLTPQQERAQREQHHALGLLPSYRQPPPSPNIYGRYDDPRYPAHQAPPPHEPIRRYQQRVQAQPQPHEWQHYQHRPQPGYGAHQQRTQTGGYGYQRRRDRVMDGFRSFFG